MASCLLYINSLPQSLRQLPVQAHLLPNLSPLLPYNTGHPTTPFIHVATNYPP